MSSDAIVVEAESPVLNAEAENLNAISEANSDANLGADAKQNKNNSSVDAEAIGQAAVLESGEEGMEPGDETSVFVRDPVEMLTDDEISMLEALFKQMNTNDDGILKPKQMAEAMKQVGADVDEETLRHQLRMGEGEEEGIDVEEFIHMMAIHMKRKLSEDDVMLAFSSFDLNKDGFIDKDELASAMQHIGFHMDPQEIEEMILDADKDGDGRISFEEFKEKMLIFGGNVSSHEEEAAAAHPITDGDQNEAASSSAAAASPAAADDVDAGESQ